MNFADAIVSGFKNYVNFKGRASRAEFWYWVLFTILLGLVLGTVESMIWPAPAITEDWMQSIGAALDAPAYLTNISNLILFLPSLSVTARRFHDAGFSAKWLFLQLIPFAYGIFALVGVVVVFTSVPTGSELSAEALMSIVFLVLPILAMSLAITVIYLVFCLKPARSFYDGNKYVEPTPLSEVDEGTTA